MEVFIDLTTFHFVKFCSYVLDACFRGLCFSEPGVT